MPAKKFEDKQPRNKTISVAVTEDDYNELMRTAEQNGRKLSSEVYWRLKCNLGVNSLEGMMLHQSLTNYQPLASFGALNG